MEDIDYPELESIRIPDKTHFKIGEVAKLLDLEPYVLRYWEKEFDVLEPDKTDSGQRSYQREDIELLATIERLLYTEMFTIDGARRQLELARNGEPSYLTDTVAAAEEAVDAEALEELRQDNERLREQLEQRKEALEAQRDERDRLASKVERLERELEAARAEVERLEEATRELEQESTGGLGVEDRQLVDALHTELEALSDLAEDSPAASL